MFRRVELNSSSSASSEFDDITAQNIFIPKASMPLPSTPQDTAGGEPRNSPPAAHLGHELNATSLLVASVRASLSSSSATIECPNDAASQNACAPNRHRSFEIPLSKRPSSSISQKTDAGGDDDDHHPSPKPAPVYTRVEIPLKDIYFYQDYISQRFMDGRPLTDTITSLQKGDLTPELLPPIQCLKYRGRWYGMGNRRLACYHYVFRSTPTKLIPVEALTLQDDDSFNALGDGMQVRVGGGLRLVNSLANSEMATLSPAQQKQVAEIAELKAVQVYKLQHCCAL